MKVLLSGFEPFDGGESNPSQEIVQNLIKKEFEFTFKGIILPVSFEDSFAQLKAKIEEFQPDFVLSLGLASIRSEITIERIGINLIEARIPDNDGKKPINEKIQKAGPDGLFSTLPFRSMLKACVDENIPASISNTAGSYVCNYILYQSCYYSLNKNLRAGFVHIPPVEKMNLKVSTAAVESMLNVLGKDQENENLNTGSEC